MNMKSLSNRIFLFVVVFFAMTSSLFGQVRRRAANPVPTPQEQPFIAAVAVTPAVGGGGTRITSHLGYVPLGTSAERQLDKHDVVPVEIFTVAGTPGFLWWMQMWEGTLPSGDHQADLIIRSPSGTVIRRAFAKTSTATVADPTAPIASVDAVGGVHLGGFRLKAPVVVLPALNMSLCASSSDYNFVPSGQKGPDGTLITPTAGMMLTVCDAVVDPANPTVDTRECHTGTLAQQK